MHHRIICIMLSLTSMMLTAHDLRAQDPIRIGITRPDLSQLELRKKGVPLFIFFDFTKPNALPSISDKLVSAYTNDPGFMVVDFRAYELVSKERERQKSEEFIDGYIVEQGRSEGVQFVLSPVFVVADNEIAVRVFDIETGLLVCSASTPLIKNKTGQEYTQYYAAILIQQLNSRCFNVQYPVVRALVGKNNSAKKLLLAYGLAHQAQEKQPIGVYIHTTELVGGQEIKRQVLIGEGQIEEVESDHFSVLDIKKGGARIAHELQTGTPVFIRVLKVEKL